jgi:hypothetical protein
MKKSLLSIVIALISTSLFAQAIPNSDFEQWISYGSYSNPSYWDTPNEETTAIPFVGEAVVFKETSAQSGSFACRMEVKDIALIGIVPGMSTLGNLAIDLTTLSGEITGGVPFTGNPYYLRGYYKYAPQGTDSCFVGIIFYKFQNGITDTIGAGYFSAKTAQTTWAPFEAIIEWENLVAPDTMNILCMASLSETATAGTKFWIDSLSFDYAVGTPELTESNTFNAYLQPGNRLVISYNTPKMQNFDLRLSTLSGQTILSRSGHILEAGNLYFNLPHLATGIYVLSIETADDRYVKKLIYQP